MNEMIKGTALSLLEEAKEIVDTLDVNDETAVEDSLGELKYLLTKIETGISKIQ